MSSCRRGDVGDLARLQSPKCVRRLVNQILKDTGDIQVVAILAMGDIDPRVAQRWWPIDWTKPFVGGHNQHRRTEEGS